MVFQLIKSMTDMIKDNQIDQFIKNNIHGSFSCDILDYETIGITEFELTTNDGDSITYDIDSDNMRLNDWTIPDRDCFKLFAYLIEYMNEVVQSNIDKNITDSFGFFFINENN